MSHVLQIAFLAGFADELAASERVSPCLQSVAKHAAPTTRPLKAPICG
jgi:hypothetical protein